MINKYFPEKTFTALLFDFDGTIADTMSAHFTAWNNALKLYGLKLDIEQHFGWAGRPTREILKLLTDATGTEVPVEEFLKSKEEHYFNLINSVKEIVPVVEIIKFYHGKMPMAVVSGSRHKPIAATLAQLKLEKYFSVIIAAEDYTHGKPAPDCFLQAAEALKVQAQDCLVFEDAQLGIEAAQAAGMACLRVVQGEQAVHKIQHTQSVK